MAVCQPLSRVVSVAIAVILLTNSVASYELKCYEPYEFGHSTEYEVGYCIYVLVDAQPMTKEEALEECKKLNTDDHIWFLPKLDSPNKIESLAEKIDEQFSEDGGVFWLGLEREQTTGAGIGWLDPSKWRWMLDGATLRDSLGKMATLDTKWGGDSNSSRDRCALAGWVRGGTVKITWFAFPCEKPTPDSLNFGHPAPNLQSFLVCESTPVKLVTPPTDLDANTERDDEPEEEVDVVSWSVIGVSLSISVLCTVLIVTILVTHRQQEKRYRARRQERKARRKQKAAAEAEVAAEKKGKSENGIETAGENEEAAEQPEVEGEIQVHDGDPGAAGLAEEE